MIEYHHKNDQNFIYFQSISKRFLATRIHSEERKNQHADTNQHYQKNISFEKFGLWRFDRSIVKLWSLCCCCLHQSAVIIFVDEEIWQILIEVLWDNLASETCKSKIVGFTARGVVKNFFDVRAMFQCK